MYALYTLHRLHQTSVDHRTLIERSRWQGCFHCGQRFDPAAIKRRCDENMIGIGQAAICPRCGNASVIGDAAGHVVNDFLLGALREYFSTCQ